MGFNLPDHDVMMSIGEAVLDIRVKANFKHLLAELPSNIDRRWVVNPTIRWESMDRARERIDTDKSIPRGYKGSVKENLAFTYRLMFTWSRSIPGGFVTGIFYGPVKYSAYDGGRRKPINYKLMDKAME